MKTNEGLVPIYVLAGFLGSGKTTLLKRWLKTAKAEGRKPAVVMNEIGEINLDGVELDADVHMAELLDGCVCCTVRQDLTFELIRLLDEHEPDLILIETTGAANPLELIEAIGDVSLLRQAALQQVVTIVDAAWLQQQTERGAGKTYRLMKEQIRCASTVVLNKTDLVPAEQADRLEEQIQLWNPHAACCRSEQAVVDIPLLEQRQVGKQDRQEDGKCQGEHSPDRTNVSCSDPAHQSHEAHHSHSHVMAYTHYFEGPVHSERFEALIAQLPENIYRAKGVLTLGDTASRFLFQYAYRQLDWTRLGTDYAGADVAVFIGEHFQRESLKEMLAALTR